MSLRIIGPQAQPQVRERAAGASTPMDNYLERLVKLVPAEAIAAFPLLQEIATGRGAWAEVLVAWVLLAVVIILRHHATNIPGEGAQWTAIIVAAVSFCIWVYVMGGDFGVNYFLVDAGTTPEAAAEMEKNVSFLSTLALVVWTIIVPVFYTGES